MSMTDNSRAFGIGIQSVKDTPVAPTWLYYLDEGNGWDWKPNVEKRITVRKTNNRHGRKRAVVTMRRDEVEVTVEFDSVQAALAFTAALGATVASGPSTWKTGATTPKYATLAWWQGESGEYWRITNAQGAKITIAGGLNSKWTVKILFYGPAAIKQSGAPSVSLTATADNSPFELWASVVNYGAQVGVCLQDFELTIDNDLQPVFCTPATAPTTGTPPGLQPTRYALGDVHTTGKVTLLYGGYTDSGLQDYLENTSADLAVSTTMPGYASAFTIDVPNCQPVSGTGLVINESVVRETVQFEGLYDPTAAAMAVITLTPPA